MCSITGCDRKIYRKELCRRHDYRRITYGDPESGGPIRNTEHDSKCAYPGCEEPYCAKGLCNTHYSARTRNGDAIYPPRVELKKNQKCIVDGCNDRRKGKGFCGKHYQRNHIHGDPLICNRGEVGKGYINQQGYVVLRLHGHKNSDINGQIKEHRLVMSQILGRPIRDDETVHHRNGVKRDNRPENLEIWTGNHSNGARLQDVYQWAIDFIKTHEHDISNLSNVSNAESGDRS